MEELGKILREERRRLGITQAELALLAGCSLPSVLAAERGKTTLRLDILLKIAQALGLELSLARRDPNG